MMKAQGYRMQKISGRFRGGAFAGSFLTLIILALCLLQNVSAADGSDARAPSWFSRHFGSLGWEEAVANSESPKDVCGFVKSRLRYSKDTSENWNNSADTWSQRLADCEDFAIVVMDMCREAGFDAWVELYFPSGRGEGHAVAVGELPDGRYWVSSFGKYETVSSRAEIAELMGAILWCNEADLWSAKMDYSAVHRKIARHQQARVAQMAAVIPPVL